MSVLALGKQAQPKAEHQQINDVIMSKARKEYYDCIQFLRQRGVNVDKQMADKIKDDIISYRIIME